MGKNRLNLPYTRESLQLVLEYGLNSDQKYTHEEIADWCDKMFCKYLDVDCSDELDHAISVAADVDCQWDLFLANTYSFDELKRMDFSKVKLPIEWFQDWIKELNTEPKDAQDSVPSP